MGLYLWRRSELTPPILTLATPYRQEDAVAVDMAVMLLDDSNFRFSSDGLSAG
jgi:hypothetical protein